VREPLKAGMRSGIRIGPDRWIEEIDLADQRSSAVDIDGLVSEFEALWAALETECEAQCCGFGAFDFAPAAIQRAASRLASTEDMGRKVGTLRTDLEALAADVYISRRLNCYCSRGAMDALLSHLQQHLPGGVDRSTGREPTGISPPR
jgi:hypothetical protein